MPVTMICPNLACRNTVVAPESARGKIVRCAHCNQLFLVPERKNTNIDLPQEAGETKSGKSKKT